MNFWIEVYWPHRPGEVRAQDGKLWLYFHEGKRRMDDKIRKGDRVLFYETQKHPDQKWPGGETLFASGTVVREEGEAMDPPNVSGGRKWVWLREVRSDRIVPEASGIPMSAIREILKWGPRSRLRRGPMAITELQFNAFAKLLGDDSAQRKKLHTKPTQSPRQPDPQKRIKLERIAVEMAIIWYENLGYEVRSVERDRVGWDLEAVCEAHTLRIEVKGLSGCELSVGLTPNEYAAMRKKTIRPFYRLFIVTNGLSVPTAAEFYYSAEENCWADAGERRLDFREMVAAVASVR